MTKFILQGGYTSAPVKENQIFFQEIVKGIKGPITILCVYFASEKTKWPELFENEKDKFLKANPNKKMRFIMATQKNLPKEAKKAKVIFLRGGDHPLIKRYFSSLKNFKSIIKGKVVVGSSAGVSILSRYYFSNATGRVLKGTGILPIKTFCHYQKNKKDKLKRLKNYGEDLKIYKIPEYKYIIFKKDF